MGQPPEIWAYNLLRTKHFHEVSSGNQHSYLLKSRYGKVSQLLIHSGSCIYVHTHVLYRTWIASIERDLPTSRVPMFRKLRSWLCAATHCLVFSSPRWRCCPTLPSLPRPRSAAPAQTHRGRRPDAACEN